MTLQEYLVAEGLNGEEISAIVGNEKQAKAMTKALGLAEEGLSALTAAQAAKKETEDYWAEKTQQLEGSVTRLTAAERRAAAAEAEAARVKAYNKSLAEAGYDVPKEMYEGAPSTTTTTTSTSNYLTREDFDKGRRSTGADLVSLTKLSNEYAYLYGKPYLSVDEDFAEAQKAGKPLTEYARTKYGFDAKKRELDQAADQKRIDEIVNEKVKAKEAELAAKYGSNPETRSPMPSKFDSLKKQPGFKDDSWKSPEGRDANRADRLKRFENLTIN